MPEDLRDIVGINIDTSCDYDCANCERYFECQWPQKEGFKRKGFLPMALANLKGIKRKIMCLGGKGGVGKSMMAVNVGAALARLGKKVTLLDQNYDCPALPIMAGVQGQRLKIGENGFIPCTANYDGISLKILSMGLVLSEDEIIIWFHDSKRVATEEFLTHVDYGEVDYLVIDVPAGTSTETVNVMKLIPDMDGSLVVTVPSEVSQNVAKRAILISQKANVPVIGVLENMGVFTCPQCHRPSSIIQSGGGGKLAKLMGVPYLGSIPMDHQISASLDEGKPFVVFQPEHEASKVMMSVAKKIIDTYG